MRWSPGRGVADTGARLVQKGEIAPCRGRFPGCCAPTGDVGSEPGDTDGAAAAAVHAVEVDRPVAALLGAGHEARDVHVRDGVAGFENTAQCRGDALGLAARQIVMDRTAAVTVHVSAEQRGEPLVRTPDPQVGVDQQEAERRLTENRLRGGEVRLDAAEGPDVHDDAYGGPLAVLRHGGHHIDLGEALRARLAVLGGRHPEGDHAGPLAAVQDLRHLALAAFALVGFEERLDGVHAEGALRGYPEELFGAQTPLVDKAVRADGERGDLDVVVDRTGGTALPHRVARRLPHRLTHRPTHRLADQRVRRLTRQLPHRLTHRLPHRPTHRPTDRLVRRLAGQPGPRPVGPLARRPARCVAPGPAPETPVASPESPVLGAVVGSTAGSALTVPGDSAMAPPIASPVTPATAKSPVASALAPSDGSSDSVAFAGISLTRTVPSSSPRPAPVTGAAARSIQHYGAAQHGVHDHSTVPMVFGPAATYSQSSNQVAPRRTKDSGQLRWPEPIGPPCTTSARYRQLEPHRLSSVPGAGTPAARGTGHELQPPPTLVVGAGGRSRGGSGSESETSTRRAPGTPTGLTRRTPMGPVAYRRELVTSSLTSSAVTSPRESSSQVRSWPRTTARAVRTAPGSEGKLHSAQSPSVSITPITSQARNAPMSGFVGLMGTYPISRMPYRTRGRTVARTAYGTLHRGHGSRSPAPGSRARGAVLRRPRPGRQRPGRQRVSPRETSGARHPVQLRAVDVVETEEDLPLTAGRPLVGAGDVEAATVAGDGLAGDEARATRRSTRSARAAEPIMTPTARAPGRGERGGGRRGGPGQGGGAVDRARGRARDPSGDLRERVR